LYKNKECVNASCGKLFSPKSATAKYCGDQCRLIMKKVLIKERQEKKNKGQVIESCNNPECNNTFIQRHCRHRFCSDSCKGKAKYIGNRLVDRPARVCREIDCRKEFIPINGNQLCCSKECAELHKCSPERQAKKYPQGYFKEKDCKDEGCSNIFIPKSPSQLYCSDNCKGYNSYYMRTYGITENQYRNMLKTQKDKCSICQSEGFLMGPNHKVKLVVDHCHETGNVRELLCHNCNRGLGLFQDNEASLNKAIEYLKKHNKSSKKDSKASRASS
jgi:hypothetical protein